MIETVTAVIETAAIETAAIAIEMVVGVADAALAARLIRSSSTRP